MNLEIDLRAINEPYRDILKSPADINSLWGGRDSGKSEFIEQALLIGLLSVKNYKPVVIREVFDTHRESTYQTFIDIIDYWGWEKHFKCTVSPLKITAVRTGNDIIFRGSDRPDKLKGLRGRNVAFFEEINQISEEAYDVASTSLRSNFGRVIEYHALNPECDTLDPADFWYHKRYHHNIGSNKYFSDKIETVVGDKTITKTVKVLHTTYKDNKWCTLQRAAKLENYIKIDPYRYRVWCLGQWSTKEIKMAYMQSFSKDANVSKEAVFIENRWFVISFDFNVDNCACLFAHIGDDFIYFFDEMTAANLPKLLDKVKGKYGKWLHSCRVTGDRSGLNRNHLQRDDMNSFRMIKSSLKLKDNQLKVIVNPPHKENRFTCNTIWSFHPNVYVNPDRCKKFIFDCEFVECDNEERIIKKDRSKANELADHLDCGRYIFNTFKATFAKNYKF